MTVGRFILAFIPGAIVGMFIAWLAVIIQLGVPNPTTISLRDLVSFKMEAARKLTVPKILIVAGSSAFAGLRADMITKVTGVPTINLGVAGGLGLPTCCRWVRELARPGDTILLAFEYDMYDWDDFSWGSDSQSGRFVRYNVEYADFVVAYEPDYFRSLSALDQAKIVVALPNKRVLDGLFRKVGAIIHPRTYLPTMFLSSVDPYGDKIDACLDNLPPHINLDVLDETLAHGLPEHPVGFAYLQDLIGWCHLHQVRVLATWPNLLSRPDYLTPEARNTVNRINQFYVSLGVSVIGDYEEALLPKEQFFDTIYHLLYTATAKRTLLLLKDWASDGRRPQ